LTRLDALKAALVGEKRGFEFYYAVAGTTSDPEIREMANQFVKEEAEHVEVLKAWITREEWTLKTAQESATV
jgi:rubrerythrin